MIRPHFISQIRRTLRARSSAHRKGAFPNGCIVLLAIGLFVTIENNAEAAEADELLDRAIEIFGGITNFSAGVDVQTIEHGNPSSGSVLAKETWRFSREGQTNRFTRNRYLPFRGQEVIESSSYSGGVLVSVTNIPLPATSSLPGFEVHNFLAMIRAQGTATVQRENDLLLVESGTVEGTKCYAWFSPKAALPIRLEKRKSGELILVYSQSPKSGGLLPSREVFQFYEEGQIKTTIIRSFSNIKELFVSTNSSSTEPKLKGNTR